MIPALFGALAVFASVSFAVAVHDTQRWLEFRDYQRHRKD